MPCICVYWEYGCDLGTYLSVVLMAIIDADAVHQPVRYHIDHLLQGLLDSLGLTTITAGVSTGANTCAHGPGDSIPFFMVDCAPVA